MEKIQSNINIVDSKLILSLPNAQMPVVWQMDLENTQSTAFTIQENKKDKNFALVSKSENSNNNEIAVFDDKQSATDILMELSNTLQNAHGKISQSTISANNNISTAHKNNSKDNKIGAGLAAALVIVLIIIWVMSSSKSINFDDRSVASSTSSAPSSNAQNSSGVAVSADEFLSNR